MGLAGLVYVNALQNPFVYDDYRTIVDNGSITNLTDARAIILHDSTRPVVNLSYAIDHAVWGPAPFGFHVTNVLLHVLNVMLLFLVWRQLAGGAHPAATAGLVAAGLFAVHPLMTEAVGYISGRSEVLCGSFFLLAILAAGRWMRQGGARWWLLAVGLWGVALLTKEVAAMLPIVLLAYDWLFLDSDVCRPASQARETACAALRRRGGAGARHALRSSRFWKIRSRWRSRGASRSTRLLVAWRYLALFFVPSGQTISHEVRPIATLWDPKALAAAAGLAATLVLAWRARRVARVASFGVFWFFALLVPSSLLFALGKGEGMAEHRVYLASGGLFLAAGSLVGSSMSYLSRVSALARLLGYSALVAGLLAFSGRTFLRNAIWADPVNLWREAADKAPTDPIARIVLGEVLHDAGRHPEAAESLQAALKLDPNEPLTYFKLSMCLTESGRSAEATAALDELRSMHPQSTMVPTGLGVVALMTGDPERARNYFNQALETDPRNVLALQWLAVLEEGHGAPAEALRRCEEIQQIEPGKRSSEDCIRRNRLRLATESNDGR